MQLNPCNKCGKAPIYEHETESESAYTQYEAVCCPDYCEAESVEYDYDNGMGDIATKEGQKDFARAKAEQLWQEANPISAAGKMLLEKPWYTEYKDGSWYHKDHDWWGDSFWTARKTKCSACHAEGEGNILEMEHANTCPLITEAKLPLKVKDNNQLEGEL